ncbi:MAG: DUF4286 family protein [Flavobacteriaceae bacterium]|jgi:hypothetical protein
MLIYNVTAHVEPTIEKSWLDWMEQYHIPEMHATQKFTHTKIFKILTDQDTGGISYAVQYHCENRAKLDAYLSEDAAALRQKVQAKFGDKVLFFRTELQLIQAYS